MAQWVKTGDGWEIQRPPHLVARVSPTGIDWHWEVNTPMVHGAGYRLTEGDALAAAEAVMRQLSVRARGLADALAGALEESDAEVD